MGRGDKKSRKGKIAIGSYGNSRPRNKKIVVKAKTKAKAPAKPKKAVKAKA